MPKDLTRTVAFVTKNTQHDVTRINVRITNTDRLDAGSKHDLLDVLAYSHVRDWAREPRAKLAIERRRDGAGVDAESVKHGHQLWIRRSEERCKKVLGSNDVMTTDTSTHLGLNERTHHPV